MARERRGMLDEVLEGAIEVPWFGVGMAVVFGGGAAYLRWVGVAGHPEFNWFFGAILWVLAAMMGVAAGIGFVIRAVRGVRDRVRRGRRLAGQRSVEDLRRLTWRAFEEVVADLYRRQGYVVQEVGGVGEGDGGVDLVMRRRGAEAGAEHLVQCKRWNAWKVGVPEVRDFYGAMAARQTRCEGIFVTCGRFTE